MPIENILEQANTFEKLLLMVENANPFFLFWVPLMLNLKDVSK